MRKLSYLLCAAVMFLAAACSDETVVSSETASVSISAQVASAISTRAYGDGEEIAALSYAIYQEGTTNVLVAQGDHSIAFANGTATLDLALTKGYSYIIALWADGNNGVYTLNADNATISVDYSKMKGNDEANDAFYGAVSTGTIAASYAADVVLQRPLAQLNFGASDKTAADLASTQISVIIPAGIPQTLNLISGDASNVTADAITLSATGACASEGNVYPAGEEYTWVAKNYILVGNDPIVLTDAVSLASGANATIQKSVENVTLQANYRTNISGELFAESGAVDVTYTVSYDPAFNVDAESGDDDDQQGDDDDDQQGDDDDDEEEGDYATYESLLGNWTLNYGGSTAGTYDSTLAVKCVQLVEGESYLLTGFQYDAQLVAYYNKGGIEVQMQWGEDESWSGTYSGSTYGYSTGYTWYLTFGYGSSKYYYSVSSYSTWFFNYGYVWRADDDEDVLEFGYNDTLSAQSENQYCLGMRIDLRVIGSDSSFGRTPYGYLGTMDRADADDDDDSSDDSSDDSGTTGSGNEQDPPGASDEKVSDATSDAAYADLLGDWYLQYSSSSASTATAQQAVSLSQKVEGESYILTGLGFDSEIEVEYQNGALVLYAQYCEDENWEHGDEWAYSTGYYWICAFGAGTAYFCNLNNYSSYYGHAYYYDWTPESSDSYQTATFSSGNGTIYMGGIQLIVSDIAAAGSTYLSYIRFAYLNNLTRSEQDYTVEVSSDLSSDATYDDFIGDWTLYYTTKATAKAEGVGVVCDPDATIDFTVSADSDGTGYILTGLGVNSQVVAHYLNGTLYITPQTTYTASDWEYTYYTDDVNLNDGDVDDGSYYSYATGYYWKAYFGYCSGWYTSETNYSVYFEGGEKEWQFFFTPENDDLTVAYWSQGETCNSSTKIVGMSVGVYATSAIATHIVRNQFAQMSYIVKK